MAMQQANGKWQFRGVKISQLTDLKFGMHDYVGEFTSYAKFHKIQSGARGLPGKEVK